jgi:hypothetical protein
MSKRLTAKERETKRRYDAAEPKQFGNLHERMKYAIECGQQCQLWKHNDIWQALWDLATEVSYTEPAEPSYASRQRVRVSEL